MIIEGRFNGPPGTGNGGYTAGLIAAQLLETGPGAARKAGSGKGAVEVTLRVPPPLETPLRLTAGGEVYADGRLVAEARPVELADDPVPGVSYGEAERASAGYPGLVDHPFPGCYVCGPDRAEGDGLRIFAGPASGGRTAAAWRVPPDVAGPVVWAALDCPGGWAILTPARPYVLGRIAALVRSVPEPGARCVVVGSADRVEGRKAEVRTALYQEGRLLASARATWIALPDPPPR